jgi:sugar lactone lactonase YvrE
MRRTLVLALLLLAISGSAPAPSAPITTSTVFETVADGFSSLRGVVVDDEDHVYVADREAGTVTRLGPDGRHVVARRLERPVGLALDSQGRVLVAEERGARVVRLDPSGPTPIVRGIKQPRWVAVSEAGTVFISARRLTRDADPEPDDESAEPETILALAADGTLSVFADGFDHLQGLAVHHDAVYAATTGLQGPPRQGGVVYRIPIRSDGQAGAKARVGPRDVFERPVGLAVDRLGAIYLDTPAANPGGPRSRQAIVKLHQDDAATLFVAGLDGPRGLAFDRHGHLYVADGNAGRVVRFLAPSAPTLAPVPPFTSQPTIALTGTTVPDARVDVFVDEAAVSATTASPAIGSFVTTAALTPSADNHLSIFATAAHGNGLTSPPAEARIVHDASAPGLVVQARPGGAFVRGTVAIRADATDAASGVATLSLSISGQALSATVTPALPASAASASATWGTTTAADGIQTLTASATDGAGNVAAVTRILIVDNTPPETEIVEGPSGATGQAGVTFAFRGIDNLAPAATLQFAWRLDDGSLGPFTGATEVTLESLAPGAHVFEVLARDPAGNEDPTPAHRTFMAGGLAVAITVPAPGAVIASSRVLVRGTIEGATTGAAVSVNGRAALAHDAQWAVEVPIAPGDNILTATVSTAAGEGGTASVAVTGVDASPAVVLRADPAAGVAPLQVTWRASSQGTPPIVRFELDRLGDGVFDAPLALLDGARSTYTEAGLWTPALRAIDDEGHVYVAQTVVQVDDAWTAALRFQTLWAEFTARLRAGDRAGALAYLSPRLQSRFDAIIQQLEQGLPQIADGLATIELIDQVDDLAEAALVQVEDGVARLYFVYFRQDNLGRWLIHEM